MFEKDRSFGINLYPDEYEDKNREADNNSKKGQYNVESPFNEFSPSTDRLKDIYKDGMTSNPIKGEQNTGTSSVIIGPMPYSGPITFPSFGFFPFPAFGF